MNNMFGRAITSARVFGQLTQCNSSLFTILTKQTGVALTQCRNYKHWDPKFKKLRKEKVIKIKIPDLSKDDDSITIDEIRSKMKEEGLSPSKPWIERQIFISATATIFEAYVPPEGDGKFSVMSTTGAKQKVEFVTKKGKSYWALRKIKTFDEDFSIADFHIDAQDIYIKAHEAIAKKDETALRLLITEKAYPEVTHNAFDKTIRWKFIQSLEPPHVVHIRATHAIAEDNVFAQITVRFHTQQTLAVYDRFGRLMHGSEFVTKDVLEYVVFEKHMANQYGLWRIHGKIIPDWMPPREYSARTFVETPPKKSEEAKSTEETTKTTTTTAAPPPPEITVNSTAKTQTNVAA